jgi:hypothetical protein
MTPLDLIHLSLKAANVTGIGQTPDPEDVNDCFILLQAMMGQWNRKRWLIPNMVDTGFVSTGADSYTVGTGGDFPIDRPDCIEAAYVRLLPVNGPSPVDIGLQVIEAHEDYVSIACKTLQAFPSILFYDATYPLGNILLYPVAIEGMYEIHVLTKGVLTIPPDLTTPFIIPPEYVDALIWNLACRIRPIFGAAADPVSVVFAKVALNTIRSSNAQVPRLSCPPALWRHSGRWAGHGIPSYASLN